jgi:hypothetical protein
MSKIFQKEGNFFRACLYCGQEVLIHSVGGNAYLMVIHNDAGTDALCFACAKEVGAARSRLDYDEDFVLDGRFYIAYTDYWITWRRPTRRDGAGRTLPEYQGFKISLASRRFTQTQ